MSDDLDIQHADDQQRRRAYELAYESWGGGARAAWVQDRMKSDKHLRADWWVGCVSGEVVCSLGEYPLLFQLEGELVSGCGLGAVHTAPDHRGQGYASSLCQEVMSDAASRGDTIALLYSDIQPAFYERLGFRITDPFAWRCDDLRAVADAVDRTTHAYPIDPAVDGERLHSLYDRAHEPYELWLERDTEHWSHLEKLQPDDDFVVVESGIGEELLYARLRAADEGSPEVVATEMPYLCEDPADRAAGLAGLAELLLDQQIRALTFGVEPHGLQTTEEGPIERVRREEGIPMVASLDGDFRFDPRQDARFWATDKF